MKCHENVHFQNDYYVPEFYPQYCQHRRFADVWNDMVASGLVSFKIIIQLIEKLAPMIKETNLVFEQDNSGFVNIILTSDQEKQVQPAAAAVPIPIPMVPMPVPVDNNIINAPRRQRRAPRCGICRLEGHNRSRCPMRELGTIVVEEEEQEENDNLNVNVNV